MKVCVIGGGIAGLQAADALSARGGHDCHVFERNPAPGGVWLRNYDGYALQAPWELYDLPFKSGASFYYKLDRINHYMRITRVYAKEATLD